jgi:hypothetical protein
MEEKQIVAIALFKLQTSNINDVAEPVGKTSISLSSCVKAIRDGFSTTLLFLEAKLHQSHIHTQYPRNVCMCVELTYHVLIMN